MTHPSPTALEHTQARELARHYLEEVPTPDETLGSIKDGCAMARYILSLEAEAQLATRLPDREMAAVLEAACNWAEIDANGLHGREMRVVTGVRLKEAVAMFRNRLDPKLLIQDAILALLSGAATEEQRDIEITAFNKGAREGWSRCGVFHVDLDFEARPEHRQELDERWPLEAGAATPAPTAALTAKPLTFDLIRQWYDTLPPWTRQKLSIEHLHNLLKLANGEPKCR